MTDQEVKEYLESIGGLKSAYYPDRIITSRIFECGSGWNKLICDLIQNLIDIGWNKEIAQIKEKFGTLRFYPGGCTEEQWKLIGEAERKSATTFFLRASSIGLPTVKEVFNKEFNSKEELLAECNNYFKTNMIEGIVVRTVDSKFSAKIMNLEYDSKK